MLARLLAAAAGAAAFTLVTHHLDAGAAKELLSMIDTIDEMWKSTGGPEKTRVNGRPS